MASEEQQPIELVNKTVVPIMQQSFSDTTADELSTSSDSFNSNHRSSQKERRHKKRHQYNLSCGMILPKRHRQRQQSSSDQHFESSSDSNRSYNAKSYESLLTSSSIHRHKLCGKSDKRNCREHSRRSPQNRPPTPFGESLTCSQPFNSCVTNINSHHFDESNRDVVGPISCRPKFDELFRPQPLLAPFATTITNEFRANNFASLPIPRVETFEGNATIPRNCDIILSKRIQSITEALEFSTMPHCLIEALPPYRVLHTNAALYALLLRTNRSTTSKSLGHETAPANYEERSRVTDDTYVALSPDISYSVRMESTAAAEATLVSPSFSSWDAIQIQINLLFGLCFDSAITQEEIRNPTIILYPVYATRNDLDLLTAPIEESSGKRSAPPRYYLIEISLDYGPNQPPVSITVPNPKLGDEKSECVSVSSIDETPKLVVA